MFGNTSLSFEDNHSLEDICINQEMYDLNQIRAVVPKITKADFFTHSLPFPVDDSINHISLDLNKFGELNAN